MNNPPSTAAANHIPSSLRLVTIARLAEILAELQRETPGVLSATLASADGLTVASTLSNNHEADKLSAMSGSLSALAGAMTREAGHGVPERLILESSTGHPASPRRAGHRCGMTVVMRRWMTGRKPSQQTGT